MRSVTLPDDGRTVRVGVFHTKFDDWFWGADRDGNPVKQRSTKVRVSDEATGLDVTAEAACSNNENFCKLQGRRIAATRLLHRLSPHVFSKADKRAIFFNICPEFAPKSA